MPDPRPHPIAINPTPSADNAQRQREVMPDPLSYGKRLAASTKAIDAMLPDPKPLAREEIERWEVLARKPMPSHSPAYAREWQAWVAEAREAVPRLIADLARATTQVETLRELAGVALTWMPDNDHRRKLVVVFAGLNERLGKST